MKSWKNRWKDELDSIVPDLRGDVKDAAIPTVADSVNNNGDTAVLSRKKPFIIAITAVFLAFLCTLTVCLSVLLPKKSGVFLFTVEINPAVSMSVDADGKVTGVIASNNDADVILSVDGVTENIIGKTLEEAAVYYTDCAARLGYIDLSQKSGAVRISAYSDKDAGKLLEISRTALQNYFTERGVFAAVIGEAVGKAEICERSRIPSSVKDGELEEYVKSQIPLFAEREAADKSIEQLQDIYGSNILESKLSVLIGNSLKINIDKVKQNALDIANLFDLYNEIFNHADNPAILLKDYWEVKKYYGDSLTGEFAQLVNRMDKALEKYEADYGVRITSITELTKAVKSYTVVTVEKITALIENFTLELFEACSEQLSEIMRVTGIVSDKVLSLMQLPQSAQEYCEKVKDAIGAEYEYRLKEYAEAYNTERVPLTDRDYESFTEQLEERYGSLSAYWQSLKN